MTENNNPKKDATRNARLRRKWGPNATCIACGEKDLCALEEHHPAGRKHVKDLTTPLCRSCHAKATDGQLRSETPLSATSNLLERVAAIFANLAAFFRFLGDCLEQLSEQMMEYILNLDIGCPGWRAVADGVA